MNEKKKSSKYTHNTHKYRLILHKKKINYEKKIQTKKNKTKQNINNCKFCISSI